MSNGIDLDAVREGAKKIHEYRTCTPECLAELTALRNLENAARKFINNKQRGGGGQAFYEDMKEAFTALDKARGK